jgi:hypothetical protein
MTIENLKANRESIIAKIIELVGEENVNTIIKTMVGGLDCCDSIDELIESAIDICEFERFAKKDSKLVQAFNNAHIDEKYNVVTKEFEKI